MTENNEISFLGIIVSTATNDAKMSISFLTNSSRFTWYLNDTTARRIYFVFFYGNNITNVKVITTIFGSVLQETKTIKVRLESCWQWKFYLVGFLLESGKKMKDFIFYDSEKIDIL